MIRLSDLKLSPESTPQALRAAACRQLKLKDDDVTEFTIVRQSIDARRRGEIQYVYTVQISTKNEAEAVKNSPNATLVVPEPYVFPKVERKSKVKPVVVGMGPAGLFAALNLARNGIPCVILERGKAVEERQEDVQTFWKTGVLSVTSNVQFGEGGAGTFSDGKLNSGTHDPRSSTVLETFVHHGAPADITYSHKPHIGTDLLRDVVKNMRAELLSLGCEIRFGHQLVGLKTQKNVLTGLQVIGSGPYEMACDALILAPGHSARDTFQMLMDAGVPLEAKSFAIGVRAEHLQSEISRSQYGPDWQKLPPSDYKLACHLPNGRSAFTFCVCPGGQIVAAASEMGGVVTNGMSYRARDGKNCNGGILVNVTPADFEGTSPLAGIAFQSEWEKAAARLGEKRFYAPVQTMGDFLSGVPSKNLGNVQPTYRPGVTPSNLTKCLPGFVTDTLRSALPVFDGKLHGFTAPGALLVGVETRSSSPVRILRGENLQSTVEGLYPCGEGAGYAGGILSAAVDGIRVAEAVATAK
ncbi:MAG: FAD-binding protein [Oscillospiraceae bacterium]